MLRDQARRSERRSLDAATVAHAQCKLAFGAVLMGQDMPRHQADGSTQAGELYQLTSTTNREALIPQGAL
jgi:uncharacterized glyoxalase superfamily protein PhnB